MWAVIRMQPGFLDLEIRHEQFKTPGGPLPKLSEVAVREGFRLALEQVSQKERNGTAGRKPNDVVLIFKMPALHHLYELAYEQSEYQVRDRYPFCRFLGLSPEGRVPEAGTIWNFPEAPKAHLLLDELHAELNTQITAAAHIPREGQIVNASVVSTPRPPNSRGTTPRSGAARSLRTAKTCH